MYYLINLHKCYLVGLEDDNCHDLSESLRSGDNTITIRAPHQVRLKMKTADPGAARGQGGHHRVSLPVYEDINPAIRSTSTPFPSSK